MNSIHTTLFLHVFKCNFRVIWPQTEYRLMPIKPKCHVFFNVGNHRTPLSNVNWHRLMPNKSKKSNSSKFGSVEQVSEDDSSVSPVSGWTFSPKYLCQSGYFKRMIRVGLGRALQRGAYNYVPEGILISSISWDGKTDYVGHFFTFIFLFGLFLPLLGKKLKTTVVHRRLVWKCCLLQELFKLSQYIN